MILFLNRKPRPKIGFLLIVIININAISSVPSIIGMVYNNFEFDDHPTMLDGTVIDYHGDREIVEGKVADLASQKTTSSSHPLSGEESLVLKLEELAIIKPDSSGWILDDYLHNLSLLKDISTSPDIGWGIQSIATGQFDNDTNEEYVAAGWYNHWTGRVIIYDDSMHQYTEISRYDFTAPHCMGDCSLEIHESAVVAGNFDGNGTDEIAIVFTEYDWDDIYYLDPDPDNFDSVIEFYIYDPAESNISKRIRFHDYFLPVDDAAEIADGGVSDHIAVPKLKVGELDSDGRDEIILTTTGPFVYRGYVYEYDIQNKNYSESYSWRSDLSTIPYSPTNYIHDRNAWINHPGGLYSNKFVNHADNSITLGDIDGDRRDEIIYLVRKNSNSFESSIFIMDDKINNFRDLKLIDVKSISGKSLIGGVLDSGDVDGDGFDEIVVFCLYPDDTFGLIFDDIRSNYAINKTWEASELANLVGKELRLADIDVDGMDEIIFSTGDNIPTYIEMRAEIQPGWIFPLNVPVITNVGSGTNVLDDAKGNFTILYSDLTKKGFITTGDFDADGIKLKYTGERWTTDTPPKVIMVIAAPPTYRGISHNYAGSYTAFGAETSREVTEGNSLTFSEGTHWSLGAEIDISVFEVFSFEAYFSFSKSITQELSRTNTKTRTETVMRGYSVGSSDDAVIYQITTFDNFKYEIVSHPTNPELVGGFMTIDVPQESVPWKVSKSYFNIKFSSIAPTIGSETFMHQPGKPWTYPNISQIESVAPIRWTASQMQTVGQGDAAQPTMIAVENMTGSQMGRSYTTETSFDYGGTIGFVTASGGWHSAKTDSLFTEVTVGEKMLYEGAVGDIQNNETWENLKFLFGLFVYNLKRTDGYTYQVINYYVENASIFEDPIQDILEIVEDITNFFAWNPELSLVIAGTVILSSVALFLRRRGRKS
ncbi:MAG: hypothetical protein ACXAC8_06080 [Candidatus Hodarchaeales archaeon]|jgi:hypothetical protein